jgi:hypothetical protein
MRPLPKFFALVVLLIGGTALAVRPAVSDIAATLKSAPQPAAAAASPPQSQTRVTMSVPFDKLSDLLNQFVFKIHGQGNAAFLSYDGVVTIDKVSVAHSSDSHYPLRLDAPFHVIGKIGTLPIDETGTATINLDITIGNAWCPLIEFDSPSVTLSRSVPVPAGFGIPSIPEYIATNLLGHELKQQLTCETVKSFLGEAWRTISLPLTVAGNTLYLRVMPRAVSVSDVTVTNDRVIFNSIVTSEMTLKTTPDKQPEPSISLPNPKKIPAPAALQGHDYEGMISGAFGTSDHQ